MYADDLEKILKKRLAGLGFKSTCTALAEICKNYGGEVLVGVETDRNRKATGREGFWYFNHKVKDRKTNKPADFSFTCLFTQAEIGDGDLTALATDITNGKV